MQSRGTQSDSDVLQETVFTRCGLAAQKTLAPLLCRRLKRGKGCQEKHSNTTAHHPVAKPPAAASTAVQHTPTDTTGLGKLPGTIL